MATEIWVNIGSGNGLLPDGTMSHDFEDAALSPLPHPGKMNYKSQTSSYLLIGNTEMCSPSQSFLFTSKPQTRH